MFRKHSLTTKTQALDFWYPLGRDHYLNSSATAGHSSSSAILLYARLKYLSALLSSMPMLLFFRLPSFVLVLPAFVLVLSSPYLVG